MKKLVVLGAIAAAGLIAWLAAGGVGNGRPAALEGPVVLISIDTLRADRLPVYGGTGARTPHIDALARDGVVFENAYAHSPQTLPSHTSILSGVLPFSHGVRDNIGFTIRPEQRFLQHDLQEAGYSTGGFVSSYVLRKQTGFSAGFDTFDDELPAVSPEQPLGQVQRRGEDTMAAAIRWIDARSTGRFFLFTHIYEPHTPYEPPARFRGGDPYDGEVAYSDEIVGTLLDHLKSKGFYDNALVILLSDHGEGLGDHGEEEHGMFLYRETIRVPLIVKMPRNASAGRRVSAPVQHIDLAPTVLELTGRTPAGRSLLPALSGTGTLPPARIYAESLSPRYHFGWSELYALSDDRYRFIRAPKDELYDLAEDPRELTSIAQDRASVRTAMRGALDALLTGATVSAPSAVSDADRQKLAALGYVGTQTGSSLQLPGDTLPDPKDKIHVLKTYREAGRLAGRQQLADAAHLYRSLVNEDPGMLDVWLRLADLHARQNLTDDALASYKQVISRDAKNAAALTGAAAVLLRAGRIEEAKGHAELAVEVAPAVAHEMLARIAVHRGDADAARRHAREVEIADPSLAMTPFAEGMLLHGQGNFAAAAQKLLEARLRMATRTEQVADLHYLAGDSLARLERYAEAEQLFRTELKLFPNNIRARGGLAMLYKATGRDADATAMVESITTTSPTRAGADLAAQLWTMFGEPGRAAAVRGRFGR